MKNRKFQEPRATSSNCLFCSINSSKTRYSVYNDKKLKIIPFMKLVPANIWLFRLEKWLKWLSIQLLIIKTDCFSYSSFVFIMFSVPYSVFTCLFWLRYKPNFPCGTLKNELNWTCFWAECESTNILCTRCLHANYHIVINCQTLHCTSPSWTLLPKWLEPAGLYFLCPDGC